MKRAILVLTLLVGMVWLPVIAENLNVNGSFDDPQNPLAGWIVDYAWLGNRHYMNNASRVSVVPKESGRRNVAQLLSPGDGGVKLETMLIPFEQGARYRAVLNVKGGPYRIYFSGYQWKPGIRPHNEPTIEEMRQAYRSKAEAGQAKSWTSVTLDIPATTASELSMQHLSRVRYITLYFWFAKDGYVDDVTITKMSGP